MNPPKTRCPHVHVSEVDYCSEAELTPLLLALRESRTEQTEFPRGTLLENGRLDLCKQSVGPAGSNLVGDALKGNTEVRALLLGTNGLGDEGAIGLAERLLEDPNGSALETLYLGCNGIGVDGAEALRNALQSNHGIRSLWLKRNPLGDAGVSVIADLLKTTNSLEVVDLVNCGMGDDGLDELLAAVAANRSLRALYLSGNGLLPKAGPTLAEAASQNPGLEYLYLDANLLGDDGASALAEADVVGLGLASNGIGAIGIQSLMQSRVEALELGYTRSTPAMGASPNAFGDQGLDHLSRALDKGQNQVRNLSLGRNSFTAKATDRFVDAATGSNLCWLEFSGHGLPPWSRQQLAEFRSSLLEIHGPAPRSHRYDIRSVYR